MPRKKRLEGLGAILAEGRKPVDVEFDLRGQVATIELSPVSADERRGILERTVEKAGDAKTLSVSERIAANEEFSVECVLACLPEDTPRADAEQLVALSGGANGPVALAALRICGFDSEGKKSDPFGSGSQTASER